MTLHSWIANCAHTTTQQTFQHVALLRVDLDWAGLNRFDLIWIHLHCVGGFELVLIGLV